MSEISPYSQRKIAAKESRENILHAYSNLLQTHGIENITIRSICKLAGVSTGCFYHHFQSRDDIMKEWYASFTSGVEKKINKLGPKDSKEKILLYFIGYAELNDSLGLQFCKRFFSGLNTSFYSHNRESLNVLYKISNELINEYLSDKNVDVENIVHLLQLVSRGVVFDWAVSDGSFDLKQKMKSVMEMIIDIISEGKI